MRTSLPLLIIGLLTSVAHAETRYTVHPTDGEFVKTLKPCGELTRNEIFNRIIRFTPTLVVDDRRVMTLVIKAKEEPADEMVDGMGWWHYNGTSQTKTMVISIKPGGKPDQKIFSLGVIRRMDELECSERWVGSVKVPRG